jgi:soluble lytic murein transglycosylase-like protein
MGGALIFVCLSCASSHDVSTGLDQPAVNERSSPMGHERGRQADAARSPAAVPSVTPVDADAETAAAPAEIPASITISIQQVSQELGITPQELRAQGNALANFLEMSRYPGSECVAGRSRDRHSLALCQLVSDFTASRNRNSASTSTYVGRTVPVRPQYFQQQQSMHYERLMKSIEREPAERILAWVPSMTSKTTCPRNLSAVAIRKLENMLPSEAAHVAMDKLYEHAAACLRPSDPGYEATHLRQALLREMWGDRAGAQKAIVRAALSPDSSETARILYWAGRLAPNPAQTKQHWMKLVENHPLSYHALEVFRHLRQDPYELFTSRPAIEFSRATGKETPALQNSLRWLETLYLLNRAGAAQRLATWLTTEHADDLQPSTFLYVSALKSAKNTPLNTILFLTKQISENPKYLNEQTLRMLFPKPYFEVFDQASPNLDTFLVLSVARQESGFNPRARSRANARGLLQLLPGTARQLTGRYVDLYDEKTNARLGVQYLSRMIEKFGSVELALAAYNAGPGRIPTWKKRYTTDDPALFVDLIPFRETRNYVGLIVRNNYWYDRLYRNDMMAQNVFQQQHQKQRSVLVNRLIAGHLAEAPAKDFVPAVAKPGKVAPTSAF